MFNICSKFSQNVHSKQLNKIAKYTTMLIRLNKKHFYYLLIGNDSRSACKQTPAAAETAITVGASDKITEEIANFSNFGKCVDIYAPGTVII